MLRGHLTPKPHQAAFHEASCDRRLLLSDYGCRGRVAGSAASGHRWRAGTQSLSSTLPCALRGHKRCGQALQGLDRTRGALVAGNKCLLYMVTVSGKRVWTASLLARFFWHFIFSPKTEARICWQKRHLNYEKKITPPSAINAVMSIKI